MTATRPIDSAQVADRRRWLALVVLCVGQLMIVLDATVVNVALPTIQRDLHFSQSSLAWVINAYLITFGGLLLLAGRLGDLIGPKRIFITGLGVFTGASAFCGFSQSQAELITARFVQGAGAAIVAATILGILVTLFPEPREKATAMGVYAFVASVGGSIGLLAGGVLTQALNWHWIFFINLPIGAAALIFGTALIPGHEGKGTNDGVDVLGAVMVTSAVMLLVYAIVKASDYGWGSVHTLGVGLVALVLLGGFVVLESRLAHPLVPLRMFRSRNLTGATLVRVLFPIGMFGQFFLGALYLQHVLGYSAITTGLAFMPMNLSVGLFSLTVSARIMTRVGARATLLPGLVLLATGLLLFSRVPVHGSFLPDVFPGMILFGIGAGLAFTPSIALAMADAAPADRGLASGLANVSIQMGAAIGIAVLASISTSRSRVLAAGGAGHNAALAGGYHEGYLIAFGCIVAAFVVALVVLRDGSVGKSQTTEQRTALHMGEGEIGL
ncbi:MAG TPA: MFS transporter [Acidimicrobiales bacterium]|jgi:EmrB/QacA subfamily drug resistance transporter|nr:MFS transporter [Acidimicrobiales bacterium]